MQNTNATQKYRQYFEEFTRRLNGESGLALHEIRKDAMNRFESLGFPTRKQEAWRSTDTRAIVEGDWTHARKARTGTILFPEIEDYEEDSVRLVFVNGRYSIDLSRPDPAPAGVRICSLEEALKQDQDLVMQHLAQYAGYEENPFAALNTAFIEDGAFVHVPHNMVLQKAIQLVFISTCEDLLVTHPRNLFVFESGVQARVVESYYGLNSTACFTNPVTEIVVGERAVIDHYKVQFESQRAFHVAVQHVHQAADSTFSSLSLSFGAALARNDIISVLDGEGSESNLNGLYVANGRQHVDNHTTINHRKAHAFSRQLYKGILDDKAKAVFNGRIHVVREAQKTDAIQSNRNLLLSEDATIDTQPQLEIFADDVRCTHGGTVGQLDENGLFYLRARGISAENAKNIMVRAFAGEVLDRIKLPGLRDSMDRAVLEFLGWSNK